MRIESSPEIFNIYRRVDDIERMDGPSFSRKIPFVHNELTDLQKRVLAVQKTSLSPDPDLDILSRRIVTQWGRYAHAAYDTKPVPKISRDDAELAIEFLCIAKNLLDGDLVSARKALIGINREDINFCYKIQEGLGFARTSLVEGGNISIQTLVVAALVKTGQNDGTKRLSKEEVKELLNEEEDCSPDLEEYSPKIILFYPRASQKV